MVIPGDCQIFCRSLQEVTFLGKSIARHERAGSFCKREPVDGQRAKKCRVGKGLEANVLEAFTHDRERVGHFYLLSSVDGEAESFTLALEKHYGRPVQSQSGEGAICAIGSSKLRIPRNLIQFAFVATNLNRISWRNIPFKPIIIQHFPVIAVDADYDSFGIVRTGDFSKHPDISTDCDVFEPEPLERLHLQSFSRFNRPLRDIGRDPVVGETEPAQIRIGLGEIGLIDLAPFAPLLVPLPTGIGSENHYKQEDNC